MLFKSETLYFWGVHRQQEQTPTVLQIFENIYFFVKLQLYFCDIYSPKIICFHKSLNFFFFFDETHCCDSCWCAGVIFVVKSQLYSCDTWNTFLKSRFYFLESFSCNITTFFLNFYWFNPWNQIFPRSESCTPYYFIFL